MIVDPGVWAACGAATGVFGAGIGWVTYRLATTQSREDRRIRERDEERSWIQDHIKLALADHAADLQQRLNGRYPQSEVVNPRLAQIEETVRNTNDLVKTLIINHGGH
jgi:hypothetical protein